MNKRQRKKWQKKRQKTTTDGVYRYLMALIQRYMGTGFAELLESVIASAAVPRYKKTRRAEPIAPMSAENNISHAGVFTNEMPPLLPYSIGFDYTSEIIRSGVGPSEIPKRYFDTELAYCRQELPRNSENNKIQHQFDSSGTEDT